MENKLVVIDDKKRGFENTSCCSHDAISFEVMCEEMGESEFDSEFDERDQDVVVILNGSEKFSESCCLTSV